MNLARLMPDMLVVCTDKQIEVTANLFIECRYILIECHVRVDCLQRMSQCFYLSRSAAETAVGDSTEKQRIHIRERH